MRALSPVFDARPAALDASAGLLILRGNVRKAGPITDDRSPEKAGQGDRAEDPFDAWLREKLRSLHRDVLEEPVPEQMRMLIERFRQRAKEEHEKDPEAG
jgi:hypothetical protein